MVDTLNGFKIFKNGIENWFSVALNMLILKRDVDCRIKNIGTVKIKGGMNYLNNSLFKSLVSSNEKTLNEDQLNILKDYINQIDNEIITVTNIEDGKKFKFLNNAVYTIFDVFLYGEYAEISYCEGKTIIDIGANVGDSTIYFANKGYDVYSFEPVPQIAKIAYKNIDLNPQLKDKITYVNKGVSSKKGIMAIGFNEDASVKSGEYDNKSQKVEVEVLTIDEILKEYDIEPNILKIDCEGCEVNIIKHSDLSMFDEIIMEYHTKFTKVDENILINILEKQGFKLVHRKGNNLKGIGIVYMKKI